MTGKRQGDVGMRVTMSDVWDRTTAVMAGRPRMLVTIAALFAFLPLVVQAVLMAQFMPTHALGTSAPGTVPPIALMRFGSEVMAVGILIGIFSLWGNLSLVAASSSPAVTSAGQAIGIGGRRLPVMIGLGLLFILGALAAALPIGVVLGVAGTGLALAGGGAPPSAGLGGAILTASFLFLLFFVLFMWIFARLFLLVPVIINERLGIRSFGRSWSLTRGLALRIVGVLILFFIVFAVASGAAQAVLGLVARLLLGPDRIITAQVIGQIAGAAVSAMLSVVLAVFSAQLYAAVTGWGVAATFE